MLAKLLHPCSPPPSRAEGAPEVDGERLARRRGSEIRNGGKMDLETVERRRNPLNQNSFTPWMVALLTKKGWLTLQ